MTLARVRAALLLVVALFVTLEAIRYVATPLWRLQFEVLPTVGVTDSGETVYWRWRTVPRPDVPGHLVWQGRLYDDARRPGPWADQQDPELRRRLEAVVSTAWLGGPQVEAAPLVRSGTDGAPWMPLYRHSRDKLLGRTPLWGAGAWFPVSMPPATQWAVRDGRYVWMDAAGNVVGGLGPDGWTAGSRGAEGGRFGDVVHAGQRFVVSDPKAASCPTHTLFVEPARRALHVVTHHRAMRHDAAVTLSTHPPAVRTVPLPGDGPIRALGNFAVAVGHDLLAFDGRGEFVGRGTIGADEEVLARFDGAWPVTHVQPNDGTPVVVTTTPAPVAPIGARVRFRVLAPGAAEAIVRDAEIAPVSGPEQAMAWARRALAIVRPPALAVASFVSPAPGTYREMFSWWLRDPLYAGGAEAGTLLLCLLVGALCAWRARQQARIRRPSQVGAWTAAAFVLGPVGLAWMRIVVPKHHVVTCACGRRRAVDVAACAQCGAGWPAPAAPGATVLSPALVPAAT